MVKRNRTLMKTTLQTALQHLRSQRTFVPQQYYSRAWKSTLSSRWSSVVRDWILPNSGVILQRHCIRFISSADNSKQEAMELIN